jgi:hypothetical protein
MTYTLIAHTELGSAQANIEFTSIPQTFTDLLLVFSLRTTSSSTIWNDVFVRPNGQTTNTSGRILYGDGSAAASYIAAPVVARANGGSTTANTFSSCSVYIPNYRVATSKSFSVDEVTEQNGSQALQGIGAFLWTDNTAISSLRLDPAAGNFAQYSSATLYGITAGSSGGVVVS